jgi:hypothetical protein
MMKRILLIVILAAALPSVASAAPDAALAWFTDAKVENSVKTAKPADALPEAPGSEGEGVRLTRPVAIENPVLKQEVGLISFWIRPDWNGNDGKEHRILRIGDPEHNGLLVEKSAENMLRFVMASPKKATASRADVSGWKAGEWHQVAIVWMPLNSKPLGTPLWIDKVAVDGPIAAGNEFLDPDTMSDPRLFIGDSTSGCVIDELIMRSALDTPDHKGQTGLIYRDYFRTAPYNKIAINPDAMFVPSDRRVVNGHVKQFGLKAATGTTWEPVTDYAYRYGQWAEFDAKPFIKWSTSDPEIATVDANGLVTGKALGKCALTAEFRGMKASYGITVIPVEQPDLDLLYVEMLPRYEWDQIKNKPSPGETMTSVVHVANFGYKAVPAGTLVRLEMIPDANENFRCDPEEKPTKVMEKTIDKTMAPRDEERIEFSWTFPAKQTWIRVTVDPADKVPEICEANNRVCELSNGRPLRFAFTPKERETDYNEKKINHVGSFSIYDWMNAQKLRFDKMVRETVIPETSPVGIQDSFRTDMYYDLQLGEWEDEPYNQNEKYFDGGFPVNEYINLMAIDAAILHEFGHCILAQPDLYGYPEFGRCVLLKDEKGKYYAGGDLMPSISDREDIMPYSKANGVPCGVGYSSLMVDCHLWLHPSQAGHVQWYRGFRGSRFWGTQGRLVPTREHYLEVYGFNDQPLAGAAVYVYHVTQTDAQDAGTKFFADRPKFVGNTDAAGLYRFPESTDEDWDDPDTDVVEGAWPVWNPFGRARTTTGAPPDVAFTPNVWCVEGLLLVKIVSGDQTEFAWLSLTDFNEAFFRGERFRGIYTIRTNLQPSPIETPIVKPAIPDAIKETNLKPEAVVDTGKELRVKCGEKLRIDGSKSRDPEGQPLIYRWYVRGPGNPNPTYSDQPVYEGTMPTEPADLEIVFFVIDGLRVSDVRHIDVHVVKE